jgi:hypothetical protein
MYKCMLFSKSLSLFANEREKQKAAHGRTGRRARLAREENAECRMLLICEDAMSVLSLTKERRRRGEKEEEEEESVRWGNRRKARRALLPSSP